MAVTVHLFAAQARAAGTYISGTANYNGGAISCVLTVVDANWTTEPTSLDVGLFGEESFDGGTTWLNAIGPYDLFPPNLGKGGSAPHEAFTAGNDGAGARLVRATLTLNQSWSGGIDLTIG